MLEKRGRIRAVIISAIVGGITAGIIGIITGIVVGLVKRVMPFDPGTSSVLFPILRYGITAILIGSVLGTGIGVIVESFRNEAHGAIIGGITGAAIWAVPGLVLGYSVEIISGAFALVVLAVIGFLIAPNVWSGL